LLSTEAEKTMQALINARIRLDMYKDILESVRHLMFFGTPHQGSLFAMPGDFLNSLTSILSPKDKTRATKELGLWSPELQHANQEFGAFADAITITSFWEKLSTKGVHVS
jgi:hypothetical protein